MGNRNAELLDEISLLLEQYRREVPGRRRAWPESIKNRALELRALGLNFTQIARRTSLPYYTVLKWHHEKKAGSFELVNVVAPREVAPRKDATPAKKVATVTEPTFESASPVTVMLPTGIRIEGVSLNFLLELLPRLGVVVR